MSEIRLSRGAHLSPEEGLCTLEVVAMLGGEGHTDQPECCCPSVGSFCRRWNDDLTDAERTELLLPLASKLVGSVESGDEIARRRAIVAVDWLVRHCTPTWLRSSPQGEFFAMVLRRSPEIRSGQTAALVAPVVQKAREVFEPPATREDNLRAAELVGRSGGTAAWLDSPSLGAELLELTGVAVPCLGICISCASAAEDPEDVVQRLQQDALTLIDRMLSVR